jgi:hypothetical protein
MPTREQYLELWGEGNAVSVPLAEWRSKFAAPAASRPEVDVLPIDMSVAFTSAVDGEYDLFDEFEVHYEEEGDSQTFLILGKMPETRTSFFVLDPNTGVIHLMDPEDMTLETVNATFAAFTRFLYVFAQFVEADEGQATRPARAEVLEMQLKAIDPSAFARRDNWWNMVVLLLKGQLD